MRRNKNQFKDLSEGKFFHLINVDRKVGRIVGVISACYVGFLIWAVMMNLGIFAKAVFITFIVLGIYFSISWLLNIYDKIKQHQKKSGWH